MSNDVELKKKEFPIRLFDLTEPNLYFEVVNMKLVLELPTS